MWRDALAVAPELPDAARNVLAPRRWSLGTSWLLTCFSDRPLLRHHASMAPVATDGQRFQRRADVLVPARKGRAVDSLISSRSSAQQRRNGRAGIRCRATDPYESGPPSLGGLASLKIRSQPAPIYDLLPWRPDRDLRLGWRRTLEAVSTSPNAELAVRGVVTRPTPPTADRTARSSWRITPSPVLRSAGDAIRNGAARFTRSSTSANRRSAVTNTSQSTMYAECWLSLGFPPDTFA